jgi:signal transduction histidine kinase
LIRCTEFYYIQSFTIYQGTALKKAIFGSIIVTIGIILLSSCSKKDEIPDNTLGAMRQYHQADSLFDADNYYDAILKLDSVKIWYKYNDTLEPDIELLQGKNYHLVGNTDQALELYTDALNRYTNLKDSNGIAAARIAIANLFLGQIEFTQSKENLDKISSYVFNLDKEVFFDYSLAKGRYFSYKSENIDSSLYFFRKAYDLADKHLLNYHKLLAYSNITYYYSMMDGLEEFFNYSDSLETMALKAGDSLSYYHNLYLRGNVYADINRVEKAEELLLSSAEFFERKNLFEFEMDTYYQLGYLFQSLNSNEKALRYFSMFITLNKIFNTKNQNTVQNFTNQKLKLNQTINQKEKLQIDLNRQETIRQRMILVIILGTVLLGIIAYLFVNKIRANKKLVHLNYELEKANSTKNKLFSIIAHDLRGPLSIISMSSELLKVSFEKKDFVKVLSHADRIFKGVYRLEFMLENLLYWSKIQRNSIQFNPDFINMNSLVHEVIDLYSEIASQKNINIEFEDENECFGYIDRDLLHLILRNLMSNSLKFTPEEGKISIRLIGNGEDCDLELSDTGIGMEKETINKILNSHKIESEKGTKGEKGSGLGLQLVMESIEIHNAKLEIESEPGKRFHF